MIFSIYVKKKQKEVLSSSESITLLKLDINVNQR